MKAKTILNEEDYDVYYIDVPPHNVKSIFSYVYLEQYALSELEKVHPFFNTHCKVDICLVLHNKKICICAVVMDGGLLSHFYGDKSLYIVNDTKKRYSLKRVFFSKSSGNKKVYAFLAACIFLVPFTYAMFSINFSNNAVQTETLLESESVPKSQKIDVQALFFSQIQTWLEQGAVITHFEYSLENNHYEESVLTTKIELTLIGLHPEDIFTGIDDATTYVKEALEISPVFFEDNIPKLHLTFLSTRSNIEKEYLTDGIFYENSLFRENIILHGGFIQEEDWDKQIYTFSIPVSKWVSFYGQVNAYFVKNKKVLQHCSFKCDKGSGSVSAYIQIKNGIGNTDMTFFENLFNEQSRFFIEKTMKNEELVQEKHGYLIETKVGSVKKSDGTELSFYINQDGKINTRRNYEK